MRLPSPSIARSTPSNCSWMRLIRSRRIVLSVKEKDITVLRSQCRDNFSCPNLNEKGAHEGGSLRSPDRRDVISTYTTLWGQRATVRKTQNAVDCILVYVA